MEQASNSITLADSLEETQQILGETRFRQLELRISVSPPKDLYRLGPDPIGLKKRHYKD